MATEVIPQAVGEPVQVGEEPILQRLRERVNRRAREAAGGAEIPTNVHEQETLRRRYRDVLAGFEKFGTLEIMRRNLVDFEEALRDLEICTACRAREIVYLKDSDASAWQRYLVLDCPFGDRGRAPIDDGTTHGHVGFYFAIADESRYLPEPVFRYHNCPGPVARMKAHAARCLAEDGLEPPPEPVAKPRRQVGLVRGDAAKGDPAWTD